MNWSTVTITVNGNTWTAFQAGALLAAIGLAVLVALVAVGGVVVAATKRRE